MQTNAGSAQERTGVLGISEHRRKEVIVRPNSEELYAYLLTLWQEIAEHAIRKRNQFCVALSGGKTPRVFFEYLARATSFRWWDKTHVFSVDERYVSLDHRESNYRMLREKLFSAIPIPPPNVHCITYYGKLERTAEAYARSMRTFFKLQPDDLPRFDLIMLGIGEDGHTASLFPNTIALNEADHLTTAVRRYGNDLNRVTLTFPVINNARTVLFLVTGKAKAGIVKRVVTESSHTLPATRVQPTQGRLLFVLDKSASSLLL